MHLIRIKSLVSPAALLNIAGTVTLASLRAATENPANTLKSE